MSVQLIIWQFTGHKSSKCYMHPVWNPFICHMTNEPGYSEWDRSRREDYLNQMLSVYNGGLVQFNSIKVQFEFETQEDLTQFVLAWS
jgi:hypothetical protein